MNTHLMAHIRNHCPDAYPDAKCRGECYQTQWQWLGSSAAMMASYPSSLWSKLEQMMYSWTCSFLTSISHVEVELGFQHWTCLAGKDSCPNLYHHWDAGHLMTYRYNPNRFWIDKFHPLCMGEFNLVHVKEPLKSILNKNFYGQNQGRKFSFLSFSCPSAGWVVE